MRTERVGGAQPISGQEALSFSHRAEWVWRGLCRVWEQVGWDDGGVRQVRQWKGRGGEYKVRMSNLGLDSIWLLRR